MHLVKSFIESFVSTNRLEDTCYCPCGSGFSYYSCCKDNVDNAWYLKQEMLDELTSIQNIISRKSAEERATLRHGLIKGLYKVFEKCGRLSSCIDKQCNSCSIESHLFPRNFIASMRRQGYNFHIDGLNKTLGANSFKTSLWCTGSDSALFSKTDALSDISLLFHDTPIHDGEESHDDGLMGELFLKVLSFKVKTVVLDQMFSFLGILLAQDDNRERILTLHANHYTLYNDTLACFDQMFQIRDGKKWVDFPYCVGKRGLIRNGFEQDKIHYQTNIKMYDGLPIFVINIIKDGSWMYFIGTTVLHSHQSNVLDALLIQLASFKENNDYVGARNWIQDEFFVDNNLYYLSLARGFFGNTYIYGEKNNE